MLAPADTPHLDPFCAEAYYIELNQIPEFEDRYMDAMTLVPSNQGE